MSPDAPAIEARLSQDGAAIVFTVRGSDTREVVVSFMRAATVRQEISAALETAATLARQE